MIYLNPSDIEKLMNPLVTLIPLEYIDALLLLNSKLKNENIHWAVTGNLGEALRTVHVDPDCIEILTDREGAGKIYETVQEYHPSKFRRQTEMLPRKAVLGEKDYPIRIRSYYFEFKIKAIPVKIYGDLQYQISDWEWGDKIEFQPNTIFVVGQKIAVVPLLLKYDLYRGLGWADRAEKILMVLVRGRHFQLPEKLPAAHTSS